MHTEALAGVQRMAEQSGLLHYGGIPANGMVEVPILDALDLGGADVNGTARHLVDAVRRCHWTAADIEPGLGVDWVMDATQPVEPKDQSAWDVVLCTEVLEHVRDWSLVLLAIASLLKPGGYAFITCASTGRRPHGARGELNPASSEYYENIRPFEFSAVLESLFERSSAVYNPNPGDLYAWARKGS
jgi:SAM-dependent methyltransferase